MKKLFVALMAVLVLASCGGDKKEAASAKKVGTPQEMIMLMANTMNKASVNFERAANADDFIDAMAAMNSNLKTIMTANSDLARLFDEMEEEEVARKYPAEFEAYQAAQNKFMQVMNDKMELMQNLTPEQQARLEAITE